MPTCSMRNYKHPVRASQSFRKIDTYLDNQNPFISKKIPEKQLVLVCSVNFGCGPLLVTVLNQGL